MPLYDKPHLEYPAQLEKLTKRGLICADRDRALHVLKRVGYYRLSAYVYPFRTPLPFSEQVDYHYRSEEIQAGTTFDEVERLCAFDASLRQLCLAAAETIEVGLRTQIAYVLGRRDTFGHVSAASLDPKKCAKPTKKGTWFSDWQDRYAILLDKARGEDFIRHNLSKYDGSPLPVWIATEILDFGALARLYGLMQVSDMNQVAGSVGFRSGPRFQTVMQVIGLVRNHAAHHGRLWNRNLMIALPAYYETELPQDLRHLSALGSTHKLYAPLATMAHLVRSIDPLSNWPRALRTHVTKFPSGTGLDPNRDMGFPQGWQGERLWHDAPRGCPADSSSP